MIGTLIALSFWTGLCLVIRREYVEQHRGSGSYKAPGS